MKCQQENKKMKKLAPYTQLRIQTNCVVSQIPIWMKLLVSFFFES